ncbi:hypothetical protein KAI32_00205 [Candidatus Pacearchaeota archaeon]|nr:hypothetical protein [Candidatus Pacearchaeota archaeon]
MIKNKRGWIRILEATIAILMVSGILIVVYSRHIDKNTGPEDYIYSLQRQILNDISSRNDLRSYALTENISVLDDYVYGKVPTTLNYSLKICNFTNPPTPCKLDATEFIATRDNNIYAEEIIISADFKTYDPKKVRLFIWENI